MMGDHQEKKCTSEPRVIYVMESVEEENMKLKESYKSKASLLVGIVHILCAVVTVATYLYGESVLMHTPIYAGIWTSLFFATSGILTIAGTHSGGKALVVATLVASILSAVSAAILFVIAFALLKRQNPWRQQDIYLMEMLMGGLMLIVSIASTLIALRSICTDASSTQPTVHISQRLQQMPRTDGCRHLQTFPDSCRRLQPPRDCAFVSLKQPPLPTGAFELPPPYPSIPPPMYLL